MNDIVRKSLLTDLGISKLPQHEQVELLTSVGRVIYEAVFMRVMEVLKEEDQKEFGKVLDRATTDTEILSFLEDHVPDIEDIIKEEVEKFKSESLNFMKKLG